MELPISGTSPHPVPAHIGSSPYCSLQESPTSKFPITVLINHVQTKHKRRRLYGVNQSNLKSVPKQILYTPAERTPSLTTVKLALLNVRSLSNKSFLINDLICMHSLDFMLLTETWLDHAKTVPTLIECAPPNFNFISTTRDKKREGGIATIFK